MGTYPFVAPPTAATGRGYIYVDSYGADNTGVRDSTTAFNNARTAAIAAKSSVAMSSGTYKVGTSADIGNFQESGLVGNGSELTTINYVGNGTCLSAFQVGTFNDNVYMAPFSGFTLDGYSAGGSANGFRFGNLQGARSQDIAIEGFGGYGLYGLNFGGGWSEQGSWKEILLIGNGTQVRFDTGSFDYAVYEFQTQVASGQWGVVLINGATLGGVRLEIRGNYVAGAGNTAGVLGLEPAGGSNTATIEGSKLLVSVECDGASGTGHYTIYMGSSSAASQCLAHGEVNFLNQTVSFQGVYNPNNNPLGVGGLINDTVLGSMYPGDGLAINGGTGLSTQSAGFGALFMNNVYWQFGDIQAHVLSNGANALIFNGASSFCRRGHLFLQQPASGAAGTVTWPAAVKWPAGTPPTLSSTNGYVDEIELIYLPSTGFYYGHLIGTHFS